MTSESLNYVARQRRISYAHINTRAVPLARKGDAHQGRVLLYPHDGLRKECAPSW